MLCIIALDLDRKLSEYFVLFLVPSRLFSRSFTASRKYYSQIALSRHFNKTDKGTFLGDARGFLGDKTLSATYLLSTVRLPSFRREYQIN